MDGIREGVTDGVRARDRDGARVRSREGVWNGVRDVVRDRWSSYLFRRIPVFPVCSLVSSFTAQPQFPYL